LDTPSKACRSFAAIVIERRTGTQSRRRASIEDGRIQGTEILGSTSPEDPHVRANNSLTTIRRTDKVPFRRDKLFVVIGRFRTYAQAGT